MSLLKRAIKIYVVAVTVKDLVMNGYPQETVLILLLWYSAYETLINTHIGDALYYADDHIFNKQVF